MSRHKPAKRSKHDNTPAEAFVALILVVSFFAATIFLAAVIADSLHVQRHHYASVTEARHHQLGRHHFTSCPDCNSYDYAVRSDGSYRCRLCGRKWQ